MKLTPLPGRGYVRDIVDSFRGYNHNLRPADGEAWDMENMCSDHAPLASSRPRRGTVGTCPNCGGILMKERLWRVEGSCLTNGTDTVDLGLEPTTPEKPKQLVSMGAYIIVLPDRAYLNTADPADFGSIDAEFKTGTEVRVYLCRANGSDWSQEYISQEEPEDPADAAVWVKTSEYPNKLYQWSQASKIWTPITVSTVRIVSVGIGEKFRAGDGVTLSGFGTQPEFKDHETGQALNENQVEQLKALDGSRVILERERDWIVVDGIVDATVALEGIITVARRMPVLDYVIEHKNRLWGCRYGLDEGGQFVNMLYASKLGDFRNWQCFQGVETDSYFANVGSDGPWTGAISYGDMAVFSKENGLHLVYGDSPGSFQVQQAAAQGVQKGSAGSMAIVGGVLYYKGVRDVLAFDGSLPTGIGYCLGGVAYTAAVGGSCGAKYLISMTDRDGKPHLFAWDTEKRLWHREDSLRVCDFASGGGETWMLCADGRLLTTGGTEGTAEGPVRWFWQSGVIGADHPDRKRLQRINVRASMALGARMRILVRYDSQGAWQQVGVMTGQTLRAVDRPVRVRRCDHLELRFEGIGDVKIHSFTKKYTTGSDRR